MGISEVIDLPNASGREGEGERGREREKRREGEQSASHLYYFMAFRENGPLFNNLILFSPW